MIISVLWLFLIISPPQFLQTCLQYSSLTQQIQRATETFQQIKLSMGEEAGARLISNSIFYISIGTKDYIRYYHHNASDPQSLYLPWSFNQLLIQGLKQEIVVNRLFYHHYYCIFLY